MLRLHNREFGEHLEITGIEGVNPRNIVGQHGSCNLQVEHIASGDRVALQQLHPVRHDAGGHGKHA